MYTIAYKKEVVMLSDLTGGNPMVVVAVFIAVVWLLVRYSNGQNKNGNDED